MTVSNPPPSDNRDKLLDLLYKLYYRLHNHRGVPCQESLLEKYNYFISHSESGRNCTYAQKCREMFFSEDYEEVSKLLVEVQKLLKIGPI